MCVVNADDHVSPHEYPEVLQTIPTLSKHEVIIPATEALGLTLHLMLSK
jgi:hypothetical protein